MSSGNGHAALDGLKVVELAQLVAGPMAGSFMADFGAEVVHVEDPGKGDPQRYIGLAKDGIPLWWKVAGRNKRSVTLDLRQESGRDLARQLVAWADVVVTNFRVTTLESWGLDWASLHAVNPTLIMLQVSGYGTNTTRRDLPGYGKVGEAMSGVVQLTGFSDGPPVHTGFSHADSLTGLFGAFAVQMALYRRGQDPDFDGEWIDLALFEPLFRLCEWQTIVHDQLGIVPVRAGNQLANVPAGLINAYLTSDGRWLTVTTGTPRSIANVAELLGEPAEDYDTREKQAGKRDHLDGLLRDYIAKRSAEEALEKMDELGVVACLVFDTAEIAKDETYAERDDIIQVEDHDLGPVKMPAVLPKLANHGGEVRWSGPLLGRDNELVYKDYLGLSDDVYASLQESNTI